MTTNKKYSCDICAETVTEKGGEYTKLGVGIVWKISDVKKEYKIYSTFLAEAEHHLCLECIKNIKDLEID